MGNPIPMYGMIHAKSESGDQDLSLFRTKTLLFEHLKVSNPIIIHCNWQFNFLGCLVPG